eukprot:TRINITY_DN76726_c0_g1_i2.p2 TRINITY_DN76726_c0_g1~~TRINITY_DN76726_c0_g1_i2.p2  ORF type:complete len:123 (-),score=17.01 TRINITY_DN76726_c0_g1_i2:28-396(-)
MADSGIFNSNSPTTDPILNGFAVPVDTDGGIDLSRLAAGTVLEVKTRNTTYTVIPQSNGLVLIWGHPDYCPEPTLIPRLGAVYVTGVFREGYLAPGMRLSFPNGDQRVQTSRIESIEARRWH